MTLYQVLSFPGGVVDLCACRVLWKLFKVNAHLEATL